MNGPTRFRASYTDGETARLHEVEVQVAPYQLTIHAVTSGQIIAAWPVHTLRVDKSMVPLVRVTSQTAGDAALSIDDPEFRATFARVTRGRSLDETPRNVRVAIAAVVVLAVGAGIWLSLTPLSNFIAHRIPFSWEQKLAEPFKEKFVTDACQSSELDAVLGKLKASVQGPTKLPMDFDIVVSNDPMVNAFALPGGVIVLNRGLLKKAESADEVAGVLAHELQHVVKRHITASLIRGAILTSIWSFTVGDFSGVLIVDPHTVYQIASLKFDRDTEADADRGAMAMLDRAKISRQGFVDFFQRLEKEGPDIPSILSTHPANDDRVAMLKQTKGPEKTHPALSAYDWQVLHTACGDAEPLIEDSAESETDEP